MVLAYNKRNGLEIRSRVISKVFLSLVYEQTLQKFAGRVFCVDMPSVMPLLMKVKAQQS